jgi:group I intron endonuclease
VGPKFEKEAGFKAFFMKKENVIYLLIDPINFEIRYVGLTQNFKRRYKQHCLALSCNDHLNNWINKLKRNNLSPDFLIIDKSDNYQDLCSLERFWIKHFKSIGCKLINKSLGGEGNFGYKHTAENIEFFRKKATDISPETRLKMSLARKGKIPANKGISPNNETRERMSKSKKGLPSHRKGTTVSPETLQLMKEVNAYKSIKIQDSNGIIYSSINDASKILDISRTHLTRLVKNPSRIFKGLSFKKVD